MKRKLSLAAILVIVPLLAGCLQFTSQSPGETVWGTIPLAIDFDEGDVDANGVEFVLDDIQTLGVDTTAPYEITWDTTTVPNGPHVIWAYAKNRSVETSIELNVLNVEVEVVGDSIGQQSLDPDGSGDGNVNNFVPDFYGLGQYGIDPDLVQTRVRVGWKATDVSSWVADQDTNDPPHVRVVELGTNDAETRFGGDGWTATDLANIEGLLTADCNVVSLPDHATGSNASHATEIDDARTDLLNLDSQRADVVTVDRRDVISAHPTEIDEDGIHNKTPTTATEDLIAAANGQVLPSSQVAAEAMQDLWWSGVDTCRQQLAA